MDDISILGCVFVVNDATCIWGVTGVEEDVMFFGGGFIDTRNQEEGSMTPDIKDKD